MPRDFDISDILSITTGKLLSPTHMDGIYAILNYMTDDNLFTHQLPRACDECAPHLRAQHPWINSIVVPESFDSASHVKDWVDYHAEIYGRTHSVALIPYDAHSKQDPITELLKVVEERD